MNGFFYFNDRGHGVNIFRFTNYFKASVRLRGSRLPPPRH
jgi:hypothetical protein